MTKQNKKTTDGKWHETKSDQRRYKVIVIL